MNLKILKKTEKKKIVEVLEENFGISDLPFLFLQTGKKNKKKIRAFSGSLSREEIQRLARTARVESVGFYLATRIGNETRLSHDSVSLLRNQINKNIITINKKQADEWLKGKDIEIKETQTKNIKNKKGFVVLRYKDDFIGTGKLSQNRITNFVPKERRIKN